MEMGVEMNNQVKKTQRKALGRGLRALISTPSVSIVETQDYTGITDVIEAPGAGLEVSAETAVDPVKNTDQLNRNLPAVGDSVFFLDVESLIGNPDQPRKKFGATELKELADSIRILGVIQPIFVRELSDYQYEIVAGERRWRAAKLAGLTQVPVIVKELEDKEALEIALVENVQRANLTATEEARAYQNLIDEFNLTQREVAERVGKDRASVANYLRLLKLPQEVLSLIDEGSLSMGHARAILTARDPSVQKNLAKKCVAEGLSVRAIEEIVTRSIVLEKSKKKLKGVKSDYPEIADRLRETLGTKVLIKHDKKQGRGKLVVEYFSEEELDRLVDIFSRQSAANSGGL